MYAFMFIIIIIITIIIIIIIIITPTLRPRMRRQRSGQKGVIRPIPIRTSIMDFGGLDSSNNPNFEG